MTVLKSVKIGERRVSAVFVADGAVEKYRMTAPLWEKFSLSEGDEVDDATFSEVRRASAMSEAVTAAGRIVEVSPQSEIGLARKLARRGFDREIAKYAAAALSKAGVLNEKRDAEAYADAAARRKKWGPARITAELMAKGYPAAVAKAAPLSVPEEEYRAALRERIKSRCPYGQVTEKERATLFSSLSRYGFSGGEIRREAETMLTVIYDDENE